MLHAPTILVLSFGLALAAGTILLHLWFQNRRPLALRDWGAAHLVAALGLPLLALRGVVPDVVSIQLGNALLAVSFGLLWSGARRFLGRPAPAAGILAGPALWLAACQVPAIYDSLAARLLVMGLVTATCFLLMALDFHRQAAGFPLRSRRIAVGIFLANAAVYLARIPMLGLVPRDVAPGRFPTSFWYDLMLLLGITVSMAMTLVMVALVREQEEREAHAALNAAREAAEQANRHKTRFLAHLSHELRTPLNGVLGIAQILAADPALADEQHERAVLLERAGRHLNALLADVLDLSSIEAGRLELVAVPTRLDELIDEVAGLTRAAAGARGLRFVLERSGALPEAVLCDPLRMRQILHNLLTNAVKFSPPGSQVSLGLSAAPGGRGMVLTVTDEGPGVPEDFRDRLFQDYSRATREAAKGDGTGLGLAISAGLARAMGGSIRFGTGPGGRGSVFEAHLPLAAVPPPPARAEARRAGPHPRLRVLVVDDMAVNRLVLRSMLQAAGHAVTEAADGAACLALLETEPLPDLVLMDVLMPGLDGLETTRRIRAMPGAAATLRIVAVTAGVMPEQRAACLQAGMDGVLHKPVDRAALAGLLATAAPAHALP